MTKRHIPEGLGEVTAALAVTLQQMKGHTLRGLLTDTRQASQSLNQLFEQRAQNGNCIPGGRFKPPVISFI